MHSIKNRLNGYSFYWALWLVQPLHGYWLTNEWVHSCSTNQNTAFLPLARWLAGPSWNCWWLVNGVVTALIITCRAEMWTIWMKFAWQFAGGEGTLIWLADARGGRRPHSVGKVLETNHASHSLLKCFVAGKNACLYWFWLWLLYVICFFGSVTSW